MANNRHYTPATKPSLLTGTEMSEINNYTEHQGRKTFGSRPSSHLQPAHIKTKRK